MIIDSVCLQVLVLHISAFEGLDGLSKGAGVHGYKLLCSSQVVKGDVSCRYVSLLSDEHCSVLHNNIAMSSTYEKIYIIKE